MRAVVVHEWGGPEVLRIEDVADPVPGAGEVLVELKTSSLNYHDVLVRQTGRGFALPRILGIDGAGIRADTGEEVVIYPAVNWGPGAFPSPDFRILGDTIDGTYAEKIVVPESSVFAKPSRLTWEEAGALPIASLTAYRALFTRAKLQDGETVLVLGAGSGVSSMALALAVQAGARVYVTSSSAEKIARSVELGAAGGFLYTEPDWAERAAAETGGVDVVIDGVGKSLAETTRVLRRGGRTVMFGQSAGVAATELNVPSLYFGQFSILGSTSGSPAEFQAMLEMVGDGRWQPVIDSVFDLADMQKAHELMESRRHFGKIVIHNS